MIVGYEVSQAMDTMDTAERYAYSKGISVAYQAVFEAFVEAFDGPSDLAGSTAFDKVNEQFEAALAAQIVRGVL